MTPAAALFRAPGLRLTAAELLALRDEVPAPGRHRPATRRPGAMPARLAGAGMDLREIRAYVEGDDMRRLDPAATARTGLPHVRSLHEDRDDTTLLIADFRASMLWGTGAALRSVRAARHLARQGWHAIARGGSVAALAVVGGGRIADLPGGGGDAQMAAIAQMLAAQHDRALEAAQEPAAADDPADPLAEALARAARLAPPGGRVLLATAPGAWVTAEDAIARLARRRALHVCLILDEAEGRPPAGILAIGDGQASRLVRLAVPDLQAQSARLRHLGARPEELRP